MLDELVCPQCQRRGTVAVRSEIQGKFIQRRNECRVCKYSWIEAAPKPRAPKPKIK